MDSLRTCLLVVVSIVHTHLAFGHSLTWAPDQALPHFPKACLPLAVVDTDNLSFGKVALLSSIQGSLNAVTAANCTWAHRGSLYLTKTNTEGKLNWLDTLMVPYQNKSFDEILEQYLPEIKCALVFDPALGLSLNLATHLAARRGCVVLDPQLAALFKIKAPHVDINDALIGKYKNKYEINNRLIEEITRQKENLPRLLLSLTPKIPDGIRELAYALNEDSFVFYMTLMMDTPKTSSYDIDVNEKKQADAFAQNFAPNTLAMGFYEGEVRSIRHMSDNKVPTVVGTSYDNYSIWSSLREPIIAQKSESLELPIEKRIYLNLVVGDGDNISYIQHFLKTVFDLWTGRGEYPLNWTISPALVDAGPRLYNHFINRALPNDYFIAGPSGLGYFHPQKWIQDSPPHRNIEEDTKEFERHWQITHNYLESTGLKVINIVNDRVRITDSIGSVIRRTNPEVRGIVNDVIDLKDKADRAYLVDHELPVSSLEGRLKTADDFRLVLNDRLKELKNGSDPLFISLTVDAWNKNHEFVNTVLSDFKAKNLPVTALKSDQFFMMLKTYLQK